MARWAPDDASAPDNLSIIFFDLIEFDTSQFIQRMTRTTTLKFLENPCVHLEDGAGCGQPLITDTWLGKAQCKNLKQRAELVTFVSGAGMFSPPFSVLEATSI